VEFSQCVTNERRVDGALVDRQNFVRGEPIVAERKFWANLKARAVAVLPWRRGLNLEIGGEFQLGDASEILFEDFGFELELVIVGGVLVVASAAASEVGAVRVDAIGRWGKECLEFRTGEAGFLFGDGGFDLFGGEDEGDEDGFAASVIVGGEAGQAGASVDEFFYGEGQGMIVVGFSSWRSKA
jgi:hypothetical protein